MRIYRSRPTASAAAAVAGISLLLTACGAGGNDDEGAAGGGTAAEVEGDTTGITDTTITFGTHHPLTGVAAPGYSEINTGIKAYFDYVNANGGICGRELEFVVRDDAYNPTQTSQVVNQLVLQDEVFGITSGLGTPTHTAVLDFLNEEQVPDLFVSSGALTWNQPEEYPYTFGWQPDYTTEGAVVGQYIAENFPDAKVGLFGQGDDFGRDGFAGIKSTLPEEQIVAEVTYTPGNTDVGPQIAQLQQAGADFVVGFNVPAYTALSQLVALRLNYNPTWFYSNVGSDATLVGNLLQNFSQGAVTDGGSLLDGIYTTKYIPTAEETDNPWTQLWTEIWNEHGSGEPIGNFRIYGMSQAYTLVQALAATCDNLNRESIVAAIEEQGSEWEGPWLAPLDYSEESHRGISGVQVVQLENGQPVQQTPVMTVEAGVTPEDYSEPQEYTAEPFTPDDDGIPDES